MVVPLETKPAGVHQSEDRPAIPPADLRLYLVAEDAVPTTRVAAVHPTTGKLRMVDQGPGDGSVLRTSALMDERVGNCSLFGANSIDSRLGSHVDLQQSPRSGKARWCDEELQCAR